MTMVMTASAIGKLTDKEIAIEIERMESRAMNASSAMLRAMARTQANWLRKQLRARSPIGA